MRVGNSATLDVFDVQRKFQCASPKRGLERGIRFVYHLPVQTLDFLSAVGLFYVYLCRL